jgi:hypothetical protein
LAPTVKQQEHCCRQRAAKHRKRSNRVIKLHLCLNFPRFFFALCATRTSLMEKVRFTRRKKKKSKK